MWKIEPAPHVLKTYNHKIEVMSQWTQSEIGSWRGKKQIQNQIKILLIVHHFDKK